MLKVHHLNNSRSQRILWLLEELDVPYEIVQYKRMSPVPLAPPELKAVHPLGKSPVITDGKHTIAESGAIIEYVLETYGKGRLQPEPKSADHFKFIEWMHYAEGSAMLPLMMHMYAGYLGDGAAPLRPRIDSEVANQLSYERVQFFKIWFTHSNLHLFVVVVVVIIAKPSTLRLGSEREMAHNRPRTIMRAMSGLGRLC